jgi:cell division protein FtsZ
MGIGSARGEGRARIAAELAIASPLLEASMDGARGVLLSIYGGSDLGLFEINEAATLVSDSAHPDANIIFGAVIDDTLGDEVKVTVIAAGFDSGQLPYKKVEFKRESAPASVGASAAANGAVNGTPNGAPASSNTGWSLPASAVTRTAVDVDEDLDIPDFLK